MVVNNLQVYYIFYILHYNIDNNEKNSRISFSYFNLELHY